MQLLGDKYRKNKKFIDAYYGDKKEIILAGLESCKRTSEDSITDDINKRI